MSKLAVASRGFLMGCADVVPGVSGGTVAFVAGIYDPLVSALTAASRALLLMLRGRVREALALIEWGFLIPLVMGIGIAIASTANLILHGMQEYPEQVWGFFLGLMLGSIVLVARSIRGWRPLDFSLLILCTVLAYHLTSLGMVEEQSGPLDFFLGEHPLAFFLSGAVAIIAMILPGISGSYLLLVLGKYMVVLGAIHDLTSGHLQDGLDVLLPFAAGCIAGLASFSAILKYLLEHYRTMTLSILLGLMSGSIHRLWPFRAVEEYIERNGQVYVIADFPYLPDSMGGLEWTVLSLAVLGVCVVMSFGEKSAP